MSTIQRKNLQTAQGMVEFALVLPILLLVVLGVFAFGHLFFAYTSVVSASREAARWGSASGVADSFRPRYRDCDAIRATAVRVGAFAGVAAVDGPDNPDTPGIYIGFDHGPNDPNPDFDTCGDDGPAEDNIGPADIGYGDRINVRVTVQYQPIVPLVNIPSFPLTATTSRTLVRSLPVGDVPAAAAACPNTQIIMEFLPVPMPATLDPVVGQRVDVRIRVTASNGTSPTGEVVINDDSVPAHSCSVSASSGLPGQTCTLAPEDTYKEPGIHVITATYVPTGCYKQSNVNENLNIVKGDTVVTITDSPDPSWPDTDPSMRPAVIVEFTVTPENPARGVPTGQVNVTDRVGHTCSAFLVGGIGSCNLYLDRTTDLVATYDGDANFNPSPPSVPEPHTILKAVKKTPTPTAEPDGDPTPTPTRTPLSASCPSLGESPVDFSKKASMWFEISNANGGTTNVNSIELTWPAEPIAPLREVRFGDYAGLDSCSDGQNCLWKIGNTFTGLEPPSTTVDPNTPSSIWDKQVSGLSAHKSEYMLLYFNASLPPGLYTVTIRFKNNCVLEIPAELQ
jgi:hypothetical protein